MIPDNHSALWTEAEVDEAIRLHAEGLTWAQVADLLGRTENAVLGAIRHKRKPAPTPWTEKEDLRCLELRMEGMPYHEIARLLERSQPSVVRRLSTLMRGAPKRSRPGVAGWGPFLRW